MNYLAHAFLSFHDEEILFGNFIGDFVKGNQGQNYSKQIQKGIALHRAIDAYTDSHPLIKKGVKRLYPNHSHYASVIIDMFADHILANEWDRYDPKTPLTVFINKTYSIIHQNSHLLPHKMNFMFEKMVDQNWLLKYQSFDGLNRAFIGLSKRTTFDSSLPFAVQDLKKDYLSYKKEFNLFFPQIITYCQHWLNN